MTRRRAVSILLLLLAAAAGGWYYWSRRVVTTASERLLPDTSVAVIEITDLPQARRNLRTTKLTEALRKAHSTANPAEAAVRSVASRLNLDPAAAAQLAELVDRDAALAWVPGPTGIEPVLVASVGRRSGEARTLALGSDASPDGRTEEARYKNIPYWRKGNQAQRSAIALVESMVVVARSDRALRAVLDARESGSTLAANSRLRAAKRLLGFTGGFLAFAALSGTRRVGSSLLTRLAVVTGMEAVAYASTVTGGVFEDRFGILVDPAKPPAVFRAWSDLPPRTLALDGAVPATASAALDFSLPPAATLWDAAMSDLSARVPAEEAGRVMQGMTIAEEILQLKLRDDLAASLGDEMAIAADLPALAALVRRRDGSALAAGHAVLATLVRDRGKWEAAFGRLAGLLGQALERRPYRRAELATIGPAITSRLALGFEDDVMVVAQRASIVEEALDSRHVGGLTARADVRAALARLPARSHARLVLSGPALARLVLQKFGPEDADPKPIADALGAAAAAVAVTPAGLVGHVRTPIGLGLILPFEAPSATEIPLPPK